MILLGGIGRAFGGQSSLGCSEGGFCQVKAPMRPDPKTLGLACKTGETRIPHARTLPWLPKSNPKLVGATRSEFGIFPQELHDRGDALL